MFNVKPLSTASLHFVPLLSTQKITKTKFQNCLKLKHKRYFKKNIFIFHRKLNILDNMLLKLEKHATNLEETVASRTTELGEEKKKSDTLLYRMLPP